MIIDSISSTFLPTFRWQDHCVSSPASLLKKLLWELISKNTFASKQNESSRLSNRDYLGLSLHQIRKDELDTIQSLLKENLYKTHCTVYSSYHYAYKYTPIYIITMHASDAFSGFIHHINSSYVFWNKVCWKLNFSAKYIAIYWSM